MSRGSRVAAVVAGLAMVGGCATGGAFSTTASTPDSPASSTTRTAAPSTVTTTATPITTTTSTTPATSNAAGAPVACPEFAAPRAVGTVASPDLDEISGLAVGRRTADVLWTHNDSGDGAVIYALQPGGELIGTVRLAGVIAIDWEDMAIGPGPEGGARLYVADIGDNLRIRPTVVIHRLPEPELTASQAEADVETLILEYPDGPHDAEALLIDPVADELVIITKREQRVYTAPAAEFGTRTELTLQTTLDVDGLITGAAIDAGGSRIFVRTPDQVLLWIRAAGESVWEALEQQPCEVPAPDEALGEAIGVAADGRTVFTISEGDFPAIFAIDAD